MMTPVSRRRVHIHDVHGVAFDARMPEHANSFFISFRRGTMSDNEPRNELETKILEAQDGRISSDELLKVLMTSQVFMPVQDEKAPVLNIQRSTRAQPLVMTAEDGTPILVLFSSPERAKPFIQEYPGFTGGILESFRWVLQNLGSGYGIVLNPDSDLGFDMEPDTVTELAQQVATEETRH